MYEAVFKNIDDTLWKDDGVDNPFHYIEQTSWVLFLKYLEDYETENEAAATLNGKTYTRFIDGAYRWSAWAVPKNAEGKLDHRVALTGDDLRDFVNKKLFPHLASFKQTADSPNDIQYKIGDIFSQLSNRMENGYTMRAVVDKVDELNFLSNADKHELSSLYEEKIKEMGNAGRSGGQYYTPRPLIKSIVKLIDPKVGETVYDGAVGSAGFLCEAYAHMRQSKELSASDYEILQTRTFLGKESKSLAYVIGNMNMILHGIQSPNILRTNTLEENLADIQEKDRVDVVLANPPFGSGERTEVQQNFPIKSGESAYLFLQHFIKMLKTGGRCGIVIKSTFLSNSDAAELRKELLSECNILGILDLPKVFGTTGVKTVVLFFEKGRPTEKIWYYQLNLDRNVGKTNPLNEADLAEFVAMAPRQTLSKNSWYVDVGEINTETWDLTVSNPNLDEEVENRSPEEIIDAIEVLDAQAAQALQNIKELL